LSFKKGKRPLIKRKIKKGGFKNTESGKKPAFPGPKFWGLFSFWWGRFKLKILNF